MVAARSRFMGAGHFQAVSEVLAGLLPGDEPTLLDVGAGDGHHLTRLLARRGGRAVALDISPAACRRAAQVPGAVGAVVADAWAPLPLADAAFDAVLSIFAPRHAAEFARVLTPDGRLLVVTPMPDHLAELREALRLLTIDADKEVRLHDSLSPDFRLVSRRECQGLLQLDAAGVHDAVSMGPNAFHQDSATLTAQIATLPMPYPVTMSVAITAWTPARLTAGRRASQTASERRGEGAPMPPGRPREQTRSSSARERGGKTGPQPAIGRELDGVLASVGQIAGRCGLD